MVGKGDRERLIPLGEEAVRWLKEFIGTGRGEILLDRPPTTCSRRAAATA